MTKNESKFIVGGGNTYNTGSVGEAQIGGIGGGLFDKMNLKELSSFQEQLEALMLDSLLEVLIIK